VNVKAGTYYDGVVGGVAAARQGVIARLKSPRKIAGPERKHLPAIAAVAGNAGAKLRDRSRSVKYRILEIGRAARSKGGAGKEKLRQGYDKLLAATSRVVGQAKPPPGIPRIFALPGLLVNLSGR
jgi:hypothetical protein